MQPRRRVFVSEFVTGGAWPEAEFPSSLGDEGRAMLTAVVTDFARLGVGVVTTWDRRWGVGAIPVADGIDVVPVSSPDEERAQFDRLAAECDATLVVAPEFTGILASRCRRVTECGGRWLGCTAQAITLCADKLALADYLASSGLAVVPADRVERERRPKWAWPVVVKPRDGAGSLHVRRIRDSDHWDSLWATGTASQIPIGEMLVQPFVPGEPLSVSAIVQPEGAVEVFPVGRQFLSDDGTFTYSGGEIPASSPWQTEAERLVRRAIAAVPGLNGYVGFDLIGEPESGRLWLVEINPRLTTSYVGYRLRTPQNLMGRLWDAAENRSPLTWTTETVRFTAAGFQV